MSMQQEAFIRNKKIEDGKSVYYFGANAGAHISHAINSALGIMQSKVMFFGHDKVAGFLEFNDLQVPLIEGDTPETTMARYQEMSAKRRAEYLKSPEHAAQVKRTAERQQTTQEKLDETVNKLEALCTDWAAKSQLQPDGPVGADLFGLLITYIDAADMIGVEKHADRVRVALESVGYMKNQYLGREQFEGIGPIQYQQKYRAYAAGQVLDMIGMIHPALGTNIEKWELHLLH